MSIVTRFAPSPTGSMHIGNARTALYNYLYARHTGGKFLLRIEDTDKERSTNEAIDIILDGLKWLGLDWDDEPIYQSKQAERHTEVVRELLEKGAAYECYLTKEELEKLREESRAQGKSIASPWRDRDPENFPPPPGIDPVIRIKAPIGGTSSISDHVQGDITINNSQLDDFILLRSDGSPTYMLAVVVDDHDMGVTHIVRGDDHQNNAFRQNVIYDAMDWDKPEYAHCPMILSDDGKKMGKRHGAVGLHDFRKMGYLPETMANYLLRLGWSHGDEEIISREQAIKWFDLDAIGKSPAHFDYARLDSLNAHYMKERKNIELVAFIQPQLEKVLENQLSHEDTALLEKAMEALKERAKTLVQLADSALFYIHPLPLPMDEKAENTLKKDHARDVLSAAQKELEDMSGDLTPDAAHDIIGLVMQKLDLNMGKVGPVIRAALCGTMNAPDLKLVMAALGKERCLERLTIIQS